MRFALERIDDVIGEIEPLLHKHWREVAHFPDIPPDPDYARYKAMENAGVLRIFTARDTGGLVGYNIMGLAPSLNYRTSLQATPNVLFVDPTSRRGLGVARAFVSHCDAELAKEGTQVVMQRTKAAHNFGNLLEALGYELVDLVYARRLDRGSVIHTRG